MASERAVSENYCECKARSLRTQNVQASAAISSSCFPAVRTTTMPVTAETSEVALNLSSLNLDSTLGQLQKNIDPNLLAKGKTFLNEKCVQKELAVTSCISLAGLA